MKTLVNCKPSEFLVQKNKIREAVAKWLTDTDIINIYKRRPAYEVASKDATAEERAEVIKRNAKAERDQAQKNLSDVFDAMLDDHPEETLNVIALCCFIEPRVIDNYEVGELLSSVSSILNDEAVLGFFTSLVQLGQRNTSHSAKA